MNFLVRACPPGDPIPAMPFLIPVQERRAVPVLGRPRIEQPRQPMRIRIVLQQVDRIRLVLFPLALAGRGRASTVRAVPIAKARRIVECVPDKRLPDRSLPVVSTIPLLAVETGPTEHAV